MTEKQRATFVFTGLCSDSKRHYRHGYYVVPDNEDLTKRNGEKLLWSKRLFRGRPGTVMSMEVDLGDEGEPISAYHNTGRHIGWWGDKEDVLLWQAEHDAIETIRKMDNLAKRNIIKEQCEPLKETYWQLSTARRRAFLTQVIQYVTNPN